MPDRLVHRPVQVPRLVDRIGVGEEQPPAARALRRRPNGVVLAGPARLQPARLDDRHPGKAAGNLRRPVGRVVVHNDDLPVLAQLENLFGLVHERLKARAQTVFLVACRDNHGQLQQLVRLRFRLDKDRLRTHRECRWRIG